MTFKKSSLVYACVCIVCLIFMASGIGLAYLGPHLLRCVIDRQLVFAPDSHLYRVWKRVPFSVPLDFYFFNWTNPEDVYDESVKPKFQQMGPYKFLQNQEKIDDRWNDNGTVTYKRRKFWHFRDEQGNGNLQDNITTINPVALSVAHVARTWSYIIRRGLSLTLSSIAATLHMTRTPSQMLFEGYPDTLIKMANTMPFFVGRELPPWDKFGWFYMRNGSADFEGVFNMGTGKNSSLGKIYQWKYWNNTPYYEGDCAKVDGFSGEFFAPNWSDTIRLFSADLCRTITLKYVGKSEVNSIIGNKYTAEDYMLDNGTIYSQNKCFCNGECVPSGVVNVSSCRFGSPTFGSLPHFYNADPYYINQIEGLQPDRKKHEFFVIIEPTTGLPLEVNARLQINLLLQPIPRLSLYERAPKIFFPVLWFEQKLKIPKSEAFKLKLILNIPTISTVFGTVIFLIGLTVLLYISYKYYTKMCEEKKERYYSQEENVSLTNIHGNGKQTVADEKKNVYNM